MRRSAATFFGSCLVLLAGGAGGAGAQVPVEEGYTAGALGYQAIQQRDWRAAERQLTESAATIGDDPARLINLGEVYYRTGRLADAYDAWTRAAAAPEPFLVRTRDGRVVSTAVLAKQALARRSMASR